MDALSALALSVFFGVAPMTLFAVLLTWFDRYEREPFLLMLAVFLWGLVFASLSALVINSIFDLGVFVFTRNVYYAQVGTAVISAPIVEESLKGLALLLILFFFRDQIDSVLDGIIYGGLVGFGFAAAENINYIFGGYSEGGIAGLFGVAAVRIFLIPFLHAMYSAVFGIGIAVSRLSTGGGKYTAPLAAFFFAVFLHAAHNFLFTSKVNILIFAGVVLDWLGFFSMLALLFYLMWREGLLMRKYLSDEVSSGVMTQRQYEEACSIPGQIIARWTAFTQHKWHRTSHFYDLCGQLAFKKYELSRFGGGLKARRHVIDLRDEISSLSAGTA